MATVTTTTATVCVGGGRRWLTKRAAYNAAARSAINRRCECEDGDHVTPRFTCNLHSDQLRYNKIVRRLAGLYRAFDKKETQP